MFQGNGQRRGGWLLRKTLSPWFFPLEVVKGQGGGGLLKATTSSSLDVGSEASARGSACFAGRKIGRDGGWGVGEGGGGWVVVVGLEMHCLLTDPGR